MSHSPGVGIDERIPTMTAAAIFRFKSFLLQLQRLLTDALDPGLKETKPGVKLVDNAVMGESRSPLWTQTDTRERHLVAGKVQNLRVAVSRLDGIEVAPGEVFSFWNNVGRANRRRGFVAGRELREGCIIPTVGGGLCQLSNALYDAALKANLEIVERHPHTQVVPGSHAAEGRDATVFWNYIDLRFRSSRPFRIEAKLDNGHLSVKLRGQPNDGPVLHAISRNGANGNGHINSCATCGVNDCFRSEPGPEVEFGKTAFLVDELVPEFDLHIQSIRKVSDALFIPIDGRRFGRTNYAWTTTGFSSVRQSLYLTGLRSVRSRRLAAQGAARQKNLLGMYEQLSRSYARALSFDVLDIVVQQQLLPFLWRDGHLGGRSFDVLMTALPMAELQSRLDAAALLHPESPTLSDFRADPELVAAEINALTNARRIITTHTDIADLFASRGNLLDWHIPEIEERRKPGDRKPTIVFPASTLGRKGCYELRDAIRGMDVRLITLGPSLEAPDFWGGFDAGSGGDDWLQKADLLVLPAFIEHRPRRLLLAAAAGIPVIASRACGVSNVPGITTVPAGDANELKIAIEKLLD